MKQLAILGTPGFVRCPSRLDPATLVHVIGGNAGNLMFQLSVTQLLSGIKTHIGLADTPYIAPEALRGAEVLVFPAANHLRLDADWTGLSGYLEAARLPLVVLGLGAQAPSVSAEEETLAALVADPHVARLAEVIRRSALFVTVRGSFTKRVCDALGILDTHVLGCPSLLVSDDPQLGRRIMKKLESARGKPVPGAFGIAAAVPWEIRGNPDKLALEQKLVGWAAEYDGLYFQQSGGIDTMHFCDGHRQDVPVSAQLSIARIVAPEMDPEAFYSYIDRRSRFHLDATVWMAETATLDFVIGTRLHGNMAAISAGTPGIVISHDSRTSELEEVMKLPAVRFDDVIAARTLQDVLAAVRFDADAFDERRHEIRTALEGLIARHLS